MWCLDMHTGSPNGGAGAVSGDGEFVVLGLPVVIYIYTSLFIRNTDSTKKKKKMITIRTRKASKYFFVL